MRDKEWCSTLGFLSNKPSLENNMRFLTNLKKSLRSLNPLRVNKKAFIGKNPKSHGFGRFLNLNCVKILTKIAWSLEPTHGPLECLERLSSEACLSTPSCLSNPAQFKNPILNYFKFKTKNDSLNTSTKPNLPQVKPL